jgi:hypothetical protein
VIVRTTLAELNQAVHAVTTPDIPMPGPARTGGDSALPMRDVIRMAAEGGLHYLAVFDDHSERPLYLGRQTRIATTDQRIICYARDGGCTRPACLAPGYHSEVHHSPAWAEGGATDADKLFFACPPTTNSSPTATAKPPSPTPAAWPGPTPPHHRKSTMPITPKNSSTATPTHQPITKSKRAQRF